MAGYDAFCKQAIGDPMQSRRFFCFAHLPPELAALVSDQPLEPLSGAGFLVSQSVRVWYKRGTDG